MREEISARCSAIEECYEFMLAYAGQGLSGGEGSQSSGQVRDYLNRAVEALSGLAEDFATAVKQKSLQPAEPYLDASIHLRALLTDLFLVDEILKPQRMQAKPVTTS
jgi:hypothetical protein